MGSAAGSAESRVAHVSFLRLPERVEEGLGAVDDRVVDHLAVELDRRGAFRLGFLEGRDDAPGLRKLLGRGLVGGVHRAELVGMDATASLEAAAPAALERAAEGVRLLE